MGLRALVLLAFTLLLPATPAAAQDQPDSPHSVIAFIDTGINPYHETFRWDSPLAYQHPSTYLPGFPPSAQALPISLDEPDLESAWEKDCHVWSGVVLGNFYWFPGTRIVGAISFGELPPPGCTRPPIRDEDSHGTMVASRAASGEYGACPDCLIVAIQGFGRRAVHWAGKQAGWIDAQSNSWRPVLPLWAPVDSGTLLWSSPPLIREIEAAAQLHLAFWGSGNGALNRLGGVGHPTPADPSNTPSIVIVGGHDSGFVTTWPSFPPHLVSDACGSWAASHTSTSHSSDKIGGGTSAAAPFVAGGAASILLEARRLLGHRSTGVRDGVVASGTPPSWLTEGPLADGVLTLQEWREVVQKTATPRPEAQPEDGRPCDLYDSLGLYHQTPVRWTDVPDGYPEYMHIGYGAVDRPSVALATQVLRGEVPMPDRSATDAYFATEGAVRSGLHQFVREG